MFDAAQTGAFESRYRKRHNGSVRNRSILESSLNYNGRIVHQFAIASAAWGVIDWWSWWSRAA
jgi:hypothetical protein